MSRRVQLSGAIGGWRRGERGRRAADFARVRPSVGPSSVRRLKTPLRVYRDGTIFGARVSFRSREHIILILNEPLMVRI